MSSEVEPPTVWEEARDLASKHFPVFPLRPGRKDPLVDGGFHAASCEHEQVERWAQEFPDANLGVPTGRASGLLVLDLDRKHGVDGVAEIAKLEAVYGALPETLTARTPNDGEHRIFKMPDTEVRNSTGQVGAGIDVRGEGGYIVIAPSVVAGKRYEWVREVEPAEIPSAWIDALTKKKKSAGKTRTKKARAPVSGAQPASAGAPTLTPYQRKAIEEELAAVANTKEGGRNHQLNHSAFALGQLGINRELLEGELLSAALVAGLSEEEALPTIKSGLDAGEQSPRNPDPKDATCEGDAPMRIVLLAEAAKALRSVGMRFFTALPTLDQATRGGIPVGRVVMLLGAPGAGKSMLAAQLATTFEACGAVVVYVAADENADGILTRFAQHVGFSRDSLESAGDAGDAVRASFAARAEGVRIAVIDGDEGSLEAIAEALEELAAGQPRVLLVDSLQTVQCREASTKDSLRERIDAKLDVLKAIAKRGALVVAISEMARGGYRTGDRNQDSSAMSSGKESGAIEYAAALLLGLRPVKGEAGVVEVEIAKNRLGPDKPAFRLRLDFDQGWFHEVEDAPRPSSSLRDRILDVVRGGGGSSANAVAKRVKASRSVVLARIREMLAEGVLVKVGQCLRAPEDDSSDSEPVPGGSENETVRSGAPGSPPKGEPGPRTTPT